MRPPGWYQDADVPGQERWWDGESFTAHTRPPAALPKAPPLRMDAEGRVAGQAATRRPAPSGHSTLAGRQRDAGADLASGKNTHATVAFVSGLLSLLGWPIACISGFVFGVLGLRRAGQYVAGGHPPLGRAMSIWALVLSGVGTAVTVVAILARQGQLL